METTKNAKSEDPQVGRVQQSESKLESQPYWEGTVNNSVGNPEDQSVRNNRDATTRSTKPRPRPTTSGGTLRQSLAESRGRLAELAEREELLELEKQNLAKSVEREKLNIKEKEALLSVWEDGISALFPVNQGSSTTNNE